MEITNSKWLSSRAARLVAVQASPRVRVCRISAQSRTESAEAISQAVEKPKARRVDEPTALLAAFQEKIFEEGAESLQEKHPKPLKINLDLLLHRARTYRRKGYHAAGSTRRYWYKKAERSYLKAKSRDPSDCRIYVGLGKLYELQGRVDDARKVYDNGCAVSAGKNPFLWTALGNLEVKENHIDRARDYFKAAVAADKTHQAAWHSWGMLENSIDNYPLAKDCWMKGIRFAKDEPSQYLYQSLAQLAEKLEFPDQARYWYQQGCETIKGARSFVLWTSWAQLEAKEENYAAMKQLFEMSLKINPYGPYVYLTWGKIEQRNGALDEARQHFLKGHRKNPRDAALPQALGILEAEVRNFDRARYYFRKSLDINSKHQYSWQAWGVMEFRLRNYDKAREIFQKGVWANPKSKDCAYIFQAWGKMEESIGNVDVARNLFRYGTRVDPRNEAVWVSWIRLEENTGDFVKANELMNYSIQERTEISLPRDFSMIKEDISFIEEFFIKFSDWLTHKK